MNQGSIRALTFDTGGTILDWHTGFRDAFAAAGARHNVHCDWAKLANVLRRRTMELMLNLGEDGPPAYNFDDAHRFCLDGLLKDEELDMFDANDRHGIAWTAPHSFTAWPDVKQGLAAMRQRFITVSFTLLSYRLVIDSSRHNDLVWDAVLSCEGLGIYKLLPNAYRRAAERLQLEPSECLMVACHPFDLDAAHQVGFKTALVRRPDEWGGDPRETLSMPPNGTYDIEANGLIELSKVLDKDIASTH